MRSAEKFSLGLKLGPSKTPVLWMVCLSCPFLAGLRDFTYLCFAASHPPPNAQPTFLVVRESLRPMKALSENLCSSLPSLPAECLCGIKLVVLVGMGAGSGFGAEQRVGIAGGLLRWVLPSGMGMVTHLFKAIRSRSVCIFQKVCPGHSCWGFFLPDTKHRGRKEGRSVPPQRAVHPPGPARCQHATYVHVLCCGMGENDSHHTCSPAAESQSKKNDKVKAVVQSVLPSPNSLLYSKSVNREMSCLGKE